MGDSKCELPYPSESNFTLPISEEGRVKAYHVAWNYLDQQKSNFLGYQANQRMDYDTLRRALDFHINNIADPYEDSNFTVNSKFMERALLNFYAGLWSAKPFDAKNPETSWGYVTSGGTEANLYGLYAARDYLKGKKLFIEYEEEEDTKSSSSSTSSSTSSGISLSLNRRRRGRKRLRIWHPKHKEHNAFSPVAFYSFDTHYSIIKNVQLLEIDTFYDLGTKKGWKCPINGGVWPKEVPSNEDGTIHLDSLVTLVTFFVEKGYPPLINFNVGSTFKGAYDNVAEAVVRLKPILKKHNLWERTVEYESGHFDERKGYWFHVDGALGSAYLPYLEKAYDQKKFPSRGPNFDFRLPIQSLAMSGHKFIGAPFPCGIFMSLRKYQIAPPDDPAYIGAHDTTFAGSRSGLAAMVLWDYTARHDETASIEKALKLEKLAAKAESDLKEVEKKLGFPLWVARSPLSLTIRFKKPNKNIVTKYSLSGESLQDGDETKNYAHIYIMEQVTPELLHKFYCDLQQKGAFDPEITSPATPLSPPSPFIPLQPKKKRKLFTEEGIPTTTQTKSAKIKWQAWP